jgi:hypothetical protein
MKLFLVSLLLALSLAEAARISRDEKYTTKYDNINLDDILASDRLVDNYFNCVMERGKCTPDGTELKAHIQDALETDCSKCSAAQRAGAEKVIIFLYKNKPNKFNEMRAKYDPDDGYYKKHEDLFKEKLQNN